MPAWPEAASCLIPGGSLDVPGSLPILGRSMVTVGHWAQGPRAPSSQNRERGVELEPPRALPCCLPSPPEFPSKAPEGLDAWRLCVSVVCNKPWMWSILPGDPSLLSVRFLGPPGGGASLVARTGGSRVRRVLGGLHRKRLVSVKGPLRRSVWNLGSAALEAGRSGFPRPRVPAVSGAAEMLSGDDKWPGCVSCEGKK